MIGQIQNPRMRLRRATPILALVLFTSTLTARADKVDDYVKTQIDAFHLPGLSLVVIKDGKIVKSAGYGLANLGKKIPATPDTVYKIGSVSKQFIATGIMLLVQDGVLGLDDPVSTFFGDAPTAWQPITIRHLLTHTAGLVRESPGFEMNKVQSDADLIKAAYSSRLLFTPGEKWAYSNLGYFTLAELIHRVSRQPWTTFMDERVFRPAGMNTTFPTNTKHPIPLLAVGHNNDNRRPVGDFLALRPSGAFLSTVNDLATWDRLLDTDRVLTQATRREMWTPVRLNNGATHPYGLGWHVDSTKNGTRVWHGGGLPGFVSHFVRYLDHGLSVVVLTNGDDVDLPSIANDVAALYLPRQ